MGAAGLPNTVSPSFTFEITTEPAPTRAFFPMETPATTVTPEPTNAPSPIRTPELMTEPAPICTKSANSTPCSTIAPVWRMQWLPILLPAPRVTFALMKFPWPIVASVERYAIPWIALTGWTLRFSWSIFTRNCRYLLSSTATKASHFFPINLRKPSSSVWPNIGTVLISCPKSFSSSSRNP